MAKKFFFHLMHDKLSGGDQLKIMVAIFAQLMISACLSYLFIKTFLNVDSVCGMVVVFTSINVSTLLIVSMALAIYALIRTIIKLGGKEVSKPSFVDNALDVAVQILFCQCESRIHCDLCDDPTTKFC